MKSQAVRQGIVRALTLTKQGHALLGGPPMVGDEREVPMENLPLASEKFNASQRALDDVTFETRHGLATEYALLDSARAINFHSLGFIKSLQGDHRSARALYLAGVEFADRAFEYMRPISSPAWGAAENTAVVAYDLHARLAAYAAMAGDIAAMRKHEAKLDDLETWSRARKQKKR